MAAIPAPLMARCGRRGLAIPLAAFRERAGGDAAVRKILRAFTVTENVSFARGRPKSMAKETRRAYHIDKATDSLIIPRMKAALLMKTRTPQGLMLLDGVIEGLPNTPDEPLPEVRRIDLATCDPEEPLYDYQEAVVSHIVGSPTKDVYLQMDTGLGKTRVGCAIIAQRGMPGLVVVPTEAIAFQWLDELADSYPGLRGGIYRNDEARKAVAAASQAKTVRQPAGPATHDMVVVIVNTFRDKTPDFLCGYGIVILDEAHELQSKQNSRALWLAQTSLVVGLSATPLERPDGLDRYTTMHLGAPLKLADIPGGNVKTANFSGEVRLIEYAGLAGDPVCETVTGATGTMSAILTIGRVLGDAARRRMVAQEVRRLLMAHEELPPDELQRWGLGPRPASAVTPKHPEGEIRRHGVFVFAELREALPALRDELEKVLGTKVLVPELDAATPADPISILRGGVARDAVSNARALGAHVVLTTYGFSRRGISLPDMTALVLASPRRHGCTQIFGRILRRGSDESIRRIIVDIVDVCTGLRGQVNDRKKAYNIKNYPITKIQYSHEQFTPGDTPAPALGGGIALALGGGIALALGDGMAPALGAGVSPGASPINAGAGVSPGASPINAGAGVSPGASPFNAGAGVSPGASPFNAGAGVSPTTDELLKMLA